MLSALWSKKDVMVEHLRIRMVDRVAKRMANIITGSRMVLSVVLLFCPVFSPAFYVLYVFAGISDMIDGAVARKTGTVSKSGSKLDTVADTIFVAVCLLKLIPVLHMETWLIIWIIVIAMIRVINVISGYMMQKDLTVLHTVMNKVTGLVLFVLPLTITVVDIKYSGAFVSAVATFAAVQEGHYIRSRKEFLLDENSLVI